MPIYNDKVDRAFMRSISREITNKIIGQEVIYYKISLAETKVNVWGESKEKMYQQPILLTCLWSRDDQNTDSQEYGLSRNQVVNFAFLKADLINLNLVPEAGDIIVMNETYYEVDQIIENQLLMGKDFNYSLESDNEKYGESWSIVCVSHLTKVNKLNIIPAR